MPAASNENTLNAETAVSRMPLALAWQPAQRASSYGDKSWQTLAVAGRWLQP